MPRCHDVNHVPACSNGSRAMTSREALAAPARRSTRINRCALRSNESGDYAHPVRKRCRLDACTTENDYDLERTLATEA